MARSQAEKARTHDRIVRTAAKRFKEVGLGGLGIADLMHEVGLTQGGFYKHFESRDDLVKEALFVALETGPGDPLQTKLAKIPPTMRELVESYLCAINRDFPGRGCPVAAFINDVPRARADARDLYTEKVLQNLDMIADLLGGKAENKGAAIIAYSTMIGALGLARSISNREMSDQILSEVRGFLIGRSSAAQAPKKGALKKPKRDRKPPARVKRTSQRVIKRSN